MDEPTDTAILEVEALLTTHGMSESPEDNTATSGDVFEEAELAEILAVTWKEKRAEISRLQKDRKFTQAKPIKQRFTREATDLKKRSKCWNCGRVGRWSKDCTLPKSSTSSKLTSSGADFVKKQAAAVVTHETSHERAAAETLLVSSPGFGIVDSGCSKTLIGQETLA